MRDPLARKAAVTAVVVFFAAFMVWLILQLTEGDLDRSDKLASVVSMYIALISLPLTMVALVGTFRQPSRMHAELVNLDARLDAMADALAVSVRCHWEEEERLRRVHDPFPLPSCWTNAPDELMDHWQSIWGSADERAEIELAGQDDAIVDTFNRVPSRRLVILGRAGAGKTILAARFVLSLLADRDTSGGGLVPVIFSLGSWDPTVASMRGWLVDQLVANHPFLREADRTEMTAAAQLLATGRVLPVLDGFDEISASLRVEAIRAINAGLRPNDRILLTSRTAEYATAVEDGDVLTATAVIQLADLSLEDATRYLPLTTRKSTDAVTKWNPVIDRMRADEPSPEALALAEVLSTPLMVMLARTVFSDTSADPAELLRSQPDVTHTQRCHMLEDVLLAGFIPAVYAHPRLEDQRQPTNSYPARDAERWLRFLARHTEELNTYDVAWWQLVRAVPRKIVGLIVGASIAAGIWLVTAIVGLLGGWARDSQAAAVTAGLVFGLAAGVVSGILVGLGQSRKPALSRLSLRIHPSLLIKQAKETVIWRAVVWLTGWTAGGFTIGLTASRAVDSVDSIIFGTTGGLLGGIGLWVVAGAVRALGAPIDPTETINPPQLLQVDRAAAMRQGLTCGLGGTLVLWSVIWLVFDGVYHQPFRVALGHVLPIGVPITVAAGASFWVLLYTAWGRWLVATSWLRLRRRLPSSLMTFLEDAHRRGVLRQAGGVYQFRHARLHTRLARTHSHSSSAAMAMPWTARSERHHDQNGVDQGNLLAGSAKQGSASSLLGE